tara:strand:- start:1997 stop:2995 length:999 start_codon:yes stop_codon:yes gene_type:complete
MEQAIKKTLPEGKTIKDTTLGVYKQQLAKIFSIVGINPSEATDADYNELIINFEKKILPYFTDNGFSNNTQKNYVNILIMLTKLPLVVVGEKNKEYLKQRELIYGVWEILKGKLFKQMEDNCKDETKFISITDFNKKMKQLRNNKFLTDEITDWKEAIKLQDYVLLMLYSGKWIRPLRNDYATFSIIHSDSDNNGKNNYLYWNTVSNKYKIILNEDKVSSIKGGQEYVIKKGTILWKFLNALVQYRMDKNQNCLLYNPQDRTCMTKNGLTKYLQKLFKFWFNKEVSSSQLRHIFISNLDFNNLTNKKLNKIAKDMRHSTSTQQFCYKQVDKK